MSAIWGQVSFEGNVYDQITVMKEPYQRKCRLDRIEQYKRPDCYMGCGIQYITGESVLEQLPYADEENGTDAGIVRFRDAGWGYHKGSLPEMGNLLCTAVERPVQYRNLESQEEGALSDRRSCIIQMPVLLQGAQYRALLYPEGAKPSCCPFHCI